MKWRKILLFLLICNVSGFASLYDSPAFQLPEKSIVEPLSSFRGLTTVNDTCIMLNVDWQISGLAISGSCLLENEESLVRVLLLDEENKEYLVFEDFYLFADEEQNFSSVAIESAILENIKPSRIKVLIRNATLTISQITIVPANSQSPKEDLFERRAAQLVAQDSFMINRWNHFNAQNEQYWIAGQTTISGISYSEKKIVLGATSDHYLSDGIEYYNGGIFVIKAHGIIDELEDATNLSSSGTKNINTAYVDSFDWRNRHGKNWMTSVKNQKSPPNDSTGSGGCWLFGAIGALESRENLYYNQLLDLDLAEQEIGSCVVGTPYPSLHIGGHPSDAYDYILSHGIVNEECMLFHNDSAYPCANKCNPPQYVVNITSHSQLSNATNSLKQELINYGPIASGYCNRYTCHVMCLCGYGTIYAGLTLTYAPATAHADNKIIIPENSNLIGETYWIYKNSFGPTHNGDGYSYIVYENDNTRSFTQKLTYPVTVSTLSTNDIAVTDADNDGYYFWGLGPKPSHCPICCPDIPDGDDSDPTKAEMDSYGNFAPYTFPYPTVTITNDTTWSTSQTQCGNVVIANNATLTITAELTMNPLATITIQNGGTLVVNAGSILNAEIDMQTLARLRLLNNGTLHIKQDKDFNVPFGAEADIVHGRVMFQ